MLSATILKSYAVQRNPKHLPVLILNARLYREELHSIPVSIPKFYAITNHFPQHLNSISGLTNKEERERERKTAHFTAVVRDLNAHRARGRGRRAWRVIAESINLNDISDE